MKEFLAQNLEILRELYVKYGFFGLSFKWALGICSVIAVYLAIHFSSLMFGNNSLVVYYSLLNRKGFLESEISRLHIENAKLQKEYFELKNLEPES